MTEPRHRAITPWVARLAVANAAVLVVFRTVVTSPEAAAAWRFDPAAFPASFWTALTYPFIHENAFHLALLLAPLLLLGPVVERRMGGRSFLLFYLYCAVGAAGGAVALAQLTTVPALSGAMAPIAGLLFAWAWYGRDEEVRLDPLPLRARLGALAAVALLALLVAALVRPGHGLSLAPLGGAMAGWLFFRLQSLFRPEPTALPMPIRRASLSPMRAQARRTPADPAETAPQPPQTSMGVEDAAEALNRVLDKISAHGLESLTPQERRLLANYADQKRRSGDH
jgi:membrane associated rhomboid family serine protease